MKTEKSILILDDEPDLCEYMKSVLEPNYAEIVCCSSPVEAIDIVKQRSFSIILSDIMMPGLPGHEFVMLLRSIGRIEPVIFVTGNASKEVLLSAVRLGVADVIEKPFEEQSLLNSVARTLEIDRRRLSLFEALFREQDPSKHEGHKKFIGLLQLANTKKTGESA